MPVSNIQSAILDLLELTRTLWPMRWRALALAWALSCIGWLVLLAMPDRYMAASRVFVNTRTALSPVLEGISVESNVKSSIDQVRAALVSRPSLETVAEVAGLDPGGSNSSSRDSILADLGNDIIIESTSSDEAAAAAGESIYRISYRDSRRDRALLVVKTLVEGFVNGTIGNKHVGSEQAQDFLKTQIKEYEARLSASEQRLAEFKKNNLGLVPGDDKSDYFARLNGEMTGLQDAKTKLAISEGRRAELGRQLARTRPYLAGAGSASTGAAGAQQTDLSSRIQDNEAKLEELLLRYTDKHPEVLALKAQIDELKRKEVTEMAEIAKGGAGSGAIRTLASNPVYQQIQLEMSQSDVEMASLRSEIGQHESQIASLKKVVNTAPEVEQKYSQLTRNYQVTKEQYTALLTRLEKANVTDRAEDTGIVKFEVIDPPSADFRPVSPNRMALSLIILLVSAVLGLGLAFLLAYVRPSVAGVRGLARVTGLPIIGTISRVDSQVKRTADMADRRRFAYACISLAGVCGVYMVTQRPLLTLLHGIVG